ncbi:uncharacterized protein LOC143264475 [Megachile rotundata]|uniref:uncharacterized protein LOC143264475 n=1 Tax=Megachile rotundata TaxID=143995 RepID=UPI003FCFEAAC
MGLTAVKALCDCNGTDQSSRGQALECFVSAKDILPSCSPILKATVRSGKCGVRRMLLSTLILLFIMAVVYCISFANQHRRSLRIPTFLRQPQTETPQEAAGEDVTESVQEAAPEDSAEDPPEE